MATEQDSPQGLQTSPNHQVGLNRHRLFFHLHTVSESNRILRSGSGRRAVACYSSSSLKRPSPFLWMVPSICQLSISTSDLFGQDGRKKPPGGAAEASQSWFGPFYSEVLKDHNVLHWLLLDFCLWLLQLMSSKRFRVGTYYWKNHTLDVLHVTFQIQYEDMRVVSIYSSEESE